MRRARTDVAGASWQLYSSKRSSLRPRMRIRRRQKDKLENAFLMPGGAKVPGRDVISPKWVLVSEGFSETQLLEI